MSDIDVIEIEKIQSRIYTIRGQRVMLDRDLAELYGVETKRLNEQVRRNTELLEGYFFELTKEEVGILWSQNATANINTKSRYSPKVFTEHGALLVASIVRTSTSIKVNRFIVQAFVEMKKLPSYSKVVEELKHHSNKLDLHDRKFQEIQAALKYLINDGNTELV